MLQFLSRVNSLTKNLEDNSMASKELNTILADILASFQSAGYSEAYVRSVKKTVCKVFRLHETQKQESFIPEIATNFITEAERRYKSGDISRSRFIEVRAITEHLIGFIRNNRINTGKRRMLPLLPDSYENLLNEISRHEQWGVKVRNDVISHARPYFYWLDTKGIGDISQADSAIIREYFIEISSGMSKLSIDSIRRGIKRMYALAFDNGYTASSFENALSFKIAAERKIMPYT
jgi:hypothetical protein